MVYIPTRKYIITFNSNMIKVIKIVENHGIGAFVIRLLIG